MTQLTTVRCDACGKKISRRAWLKVSLWNNYEEETTFDICDECQPLMDRAIAIGLRRATDGNGRRLKVVAEEES